MALANDADLLFGVVAIVLGVLLMVGVLSLELILGIGLLTFGISVLAKRL